MADPDLQIMEGGGGGRADPDPYIREGGRSKKEKFFSALRGSV